ncbi:hypothetical protein B0J11DRAFT_507147 [Dendryphion nanum]|uniref:Uncharacterized protein n=1 Tax=Dendryphion nanum TaxID=256645 RepID=A0A9P9DRU0_9PLEO|nr:hypothetical protein B0J11DRAFT_507147 [Dendryphion nanum]
MRSPVKQTNPSSTSLEGLERPVRSFKSFIKSVPRNPTLPRSNSNSNSNSNKPLPPTPPPPSETLSSPPSPSSMLSSPRRSSSVTSWKAPAEWFNDASVASKTYFGAPPAPSGRIYSLLIPEPSPDLNERFMELSANGGPSPPLPSRLRPIYERPNLDLRPPRSPPKSPLPTPPLIPPKSKARLHRESVARLPVEINPWETAIGGNGNLTYPLSGENSRLGPASPVYSTASQTSNISTKEKAFASIGLESPTESSPGFDKYREPPDQYRSDRQFRGRKIRSLNKGNPLTNDSLEDPDLDDKARQLSFSQDYHDLLVDQYQEMNARSSPRPQKSPLRISSNAPDLDETSNPPLADHGLIPPPLSWRKSSIGLPPPDSSYNIMDVPESKFEHSSSPSSTKKNRLSGKLSSWLPNHLSVGSKWNGVKEIHENPLERQGSSSSERKKPKSPTDKDLHFSNFFGHSKPLKLRRKASKQKSTDERSASISVPSPTSQPIRFPGGIAAVQTPPQIKQSEQVSFVEPSIVGNAARSSSIPRSIASSFQTNSLISNASERRLSYTSPPTGPIETRVPATRIDIRASTGSSYSRHSSGSGTTQNPSSPPIVATPKPNKSPTSSQHQSREPGDSTWQKPGFLEKARDARKRHNRDIRQKKLKDSIRVLGPTDPDVVASYVKREGRQGEEQGKEIAGRLPGFMVSGPV